MPIEGFLKQFIEDYLLRDLDSMAAVSPPPGQTGACGFSMVLVTLAGCELLGALTHTRPFHPRNGAEQFYHFWRNGLYPNDRVRADLAPAIRKLVRHGLAHAFVPKPLILVTKNKGTKNHLSCDAEGVLIVDCLTLAEDFRTAYEQFVKPKIQTGERSWLQKQLVLIQTEGTEQAEEEVALRIGNLPRTDPTEAQYFIPSGQVSITSVNSPTLPPRWRSEP
jgi:hypothetical protein